MTLLAVGIGRSTRALLSTISKSRANYWASYVVDATCPFLFAYLGLRHPLGLREAVISFVLGLTAFTLVEYSIHRWLLHDSKGALFTLHEAHHVDPGKPAAFLFPTSLVVLTPVWLLLTVIDVRAASFFLSGFSSAYCCFGALHHVEHTTRINQLPFRWLKKRWAAHSVHHHLDHTNYGVVTSFWDHVFGTHQKQVKQKSPSHT
jgi:sterol desaturase/sphingolipid hydroxylase (fatty acid hydroxylase superfamily)